LVPQWLGNVAVVDAPEDRPFRDFREKQIVQPRLQRLGCIPDDRLEVFRSSGACLVGLRPPEFIDETAKAVSRDVLERPSDDFRSPPTAAGKAEQQ
jgi:hypothetical protein